MRTLANQCLPLILVMMKGPLCFVAVMQTRTHMHTHWLNRRLTPADNAVCYLINQMSAGAFQQVCGRARIHKSRSRVTRHEGVTLLAKIKMQVFISDRHVLLCSSPAQSVCVSKNKDPFMSHKLFMCIDFTHENCCTHFQLCSVWNWSKPTFKLQWRTQKLVLKKTRAQRSYLMNAHSVERCNVQPRWLVWSQVNNFTAWKATSLHNTLGGETRKEITISPGCLSLC